MAEVYLNCGNKELNSATGKWALSHGYQIFPGPGTGNAPVSWGRW